MSPSPPENIRKYYQKSFLLANARNTLSQGFFTHFAIKKQGFLMFSGGIKRVSSEEMG